MNMTTNMVDGIIFDNIEMDLEFARTQIQCLMEMNKELSSSKEKLQKEVDIQKEMKAREVYRRKGVEEDNERLSKQLEALKNEVKLIKRRPDWIFVRRADEEIQKARNEIYRINRINSDLHKKLETSQIEYQKLLRKYNNKN